jgi:hypothetical protein
MYKSQWGFGVLIYLIIVYNTTPFMSNYVVAIPSYNRYDVIVHKTLTTLKEGNVSSNKIYIFVANKEEEHKYKEQVPSHLYNKIVVGEKGICNQRVFISKHFPEHQYIVSMDDDVEEMQIMKSADKLVKIKNLDAFFQEAYRDLKKEKLYMWGIYPVRNPFFMKKKISTHLRFIIGVTFGYINRHDKSLYPTTKSETKEDYEQSILFYKKDGGVIRYNYITPKTKFNAEGGLGKDRFQRNKNAAAYLQKKYPDIITVFHRANGMAEVKFSNHPRLICPTPRKNKSRKNKSMKNKSRKKK